MRLEGRRVLVTGAGSGIGRALAIEAASASARLVLVGRNADTLAGTVALMKPGADVAIEAVDVTRPEAVRALAARVDQRFGVLDVLVNNAGVVTVGPVAEIDPGALAGMVETNLVAPIMMTVAFLPLLRRSTQPHVVNTGSMLGEIALPLFAAYGATKAGLRAWSNGLRRELAREGVRVTYAAPRATKTGAATAFSHLVEPYAMRLDAPGTVARQIWSAVCRGRRNVYPKGPERLFRVIEMLAPRLVDGGVAKQYRRVLHGTDA